MTLIDYANRDRTQHLSPPVSYSANDYNVSDASKIKSTNFEVVDKVEGKLYKKASIGEVTRLIKRLVNQYL